jgi:hypothetical protein
MSRMSVVVVIEVDGITDLDGIDADNAIECIADALKGADLPGQWRIEETFGEQSRQVTTNEERAERAAGALIRYADLKGGLPPDADRALADLMADAVHLLGMDAFRNSLRMAGIQSSEEP